MRFLPKLPPGMRLIKTTGVIVLDRALPPPGLTESQRLDAVGPDGRTQRQRLAEAQGVRARLAAGWQPSDGELAGSPTLTDWRILVLGGEISLDGIVHGHPRIADGHDCWTSPMIAIDAVLARWARTVSRWYLLGRPYREEDDI